MKLSLFITEHIEALLVAWESFARAEAASTIHMGKAELRDHAKQILEAIALDLETTQSNWERDQKSKGLAPTSDEEESAASTHGYLRRDSGFTLLQLTAEYRALRASVLKLWQQEVGDLRGQDVRDLIRFNEAIDQALSESVFEYEAHAGEINSDLESRVRCRTAELNLARSDAESANLAKSEFLATMSHEIRTPMGGLLGLLELLAASQLDADQRSTLSVARESGDALMHIINDILEFSKLEANGVEINLVAAPVATAVSSACRLHSQAAAAKALVLQAHIAPKISPFLSFDPLRVGQILNNLISNAIKFTATGRIDVGVELLNRRDAMEELLFTVRDTGIGMTPGNLGRLFEPFLQAEPGTAMKFGGTGLGLVISKRLAELMGGTLEVKSEAGVGTCMSLRISFEICNAASSPRPQQTDNTALDNLCAGRRAIPTVSTAEADHTLLLIVDDHPTNRMVLIRQAAMLGYAAEAVADGAEALVAWRSGRFAAVITDCSMPVMDGYQLAREIRAAETKQSDERIPIIACTANVLPAATELCLQCGMDDCLVKPTSLSDLSAVLARWVPLPTALDPREAREKVPDPTSKPRAGTFRNEEGLPDKVLLREISGGDHLAQAEILFEFRRVSEADARDLRLAANVPDFAQVAQLSHRIKESSLMLGATRLAHVCEEIETASTVGDAVGLSAVMPIFEMELLRLTRYVEQFASVTHGGA